MLGICWAATSSSSISVSFYQLCGEAWKGFTLTAAHTKTFVLLFTAATKQERGSIKVVHSQHIKIRAELLLLSLWWLQGKDSLTTDKCRIPQCLPVKRLPRRHAIELSKTVVIHALRKCIYFSPHLLFFSHLPTWLSISIPYLVLQETH